MPNHCGFSFPVAPPCVPIIAGAWKTFRNEFTWEREMCSVGLWDGQMWTFGFLSLCALLLPVASAFHCHPRSPHILLLAHCFLFWRQGSRNVKSYHRVDQLNNLGVHWQVFLRYGFKTHNTRNENLLQYISGLLYNLRSGHNKATTIWLF